MNANKGASHRSLKSDLARVDAHKLKPDEYEELPELADGMLARARVNKGGSRREHPGFRVEISVDAK